MFTDFHNPQPQGQDAAESYGNIKRGFREAEHGVHQLGKNRLIAEYQPFKARCDERR